MSIAPDSVSYPVLATIRAGHYHPELLYQSASYIRACLEAGHMPDEGTAEWYVLLTENMRRSFNHFNPDKRV